MARVLLIDDKEDLLHFFSALFEVIGYDVAIASNKDGLYKQLAETIPDIILMDVMLGRTDGRLLCMEIKSKYNNIPVILMSASNDHLKDYKECNADFALEKPFDIKMIQETISLALAKYSIDNHIVPPATFKDSLQ